MTAGPGREGQDGAAAQVLTRTVELARIPAPTGAEENRASVVRRWWDDDGWAPSVDSAGNVWGRAGGGPGPALLVAAHLDTVFPADLPHEVVVTPARLTGPSVGDDSIGVAALSAVARQAGPVRARYGWSQPWRAWATSPGSGMPWRTHRSPSRPSSPSKATTSAGSSSPAWGRSGGGFTTTGRAGMPGSGPARPARCTPPPEPLRASLIWPFQAPGEA